MTNRIARRLPRFLSQIDDFLDLMEAEDLEFDLLDDNIKEFVLAMFINKLEEAKNPEEALRALERDYKLDHRGTIRERVTAILVKKNFNDTSTVERLEELGDSFSPYDDVVKIIPRNEEYYFIADIDINRGKYNIGGFVEALYERKPAHLEANIHLRCTDKINIKDKTSSFMSRYYYSGEHNTGSVPKHIYTGQKHTDILSLPNYSKPVEQRNHYVGERSAADDSK